MSKDRCTWIVCKNCGWTYMSITYVQNLAQIFIYSLKHKQCLCRISRWLWYPPFKNVFLLVFYLKIKVINVWDQSFGNFSHYKYYCKYLVYLNCCLQFFAYFFFPPIFKGEDYIEKKQTKQKHNSVILGPKLFTEF